MLVAEVITIGNEILDGRVTDSNRVFIGRHLKELGYEICYAQSVDDNMDRVVEALKLAKSRSNLVICTGGLGPTTDDLTAEAAAKFLECPWELNKEAATFLKKLFAKRNRELNESQLKQAKLPQACTMISNPVGTAPGFFYKKKDFSIYFFPGVPRELYSMFESIASKLVKGDGKLKNYTWSTIFTSEGNLQEQIKDVEKGISPFRIGFRTQLPENFVSLMGRVENADQEKKWNKIIPKLSKILSPVSYSEGVERNYEELLFEKLAAKKARILIVESCTGGLISSLLTDIPGSSKCVWGSQVCYANEEKIRLGVNKQTIEKFGAVSEECAIEMAVSGLNRLKADGDSSSLICLSTTGIAGPSGGSKNKPVGMMYVGVAATGKNFDVPSGSTKLLSRCLQAPGFLERKLIKLYMAKQALDVVRVNFL
jgi:nicotinamide-nucleotide amidase